MGTTAKPRMRRAAPSLEKLIKVSPEVHQRIKIKAAQAGKKMGDYVDEKTKD